MAKWEQSTAVGLAGLAAFQLLQAWNANAPSLMEIRAAPARDVTCAQQLMDADFLVGGLAVVVGVTITILTHDATAALVLLTSFGMMSLWYHSVLAAHPV